MILRSASRPLASNVASNGTDFAASPSAQERDQVTVHTGLSRLWHSGSPRGFEEVEHRRVRFSARPEQLPARGAHMGAPVLLRAFGVTGLDQVYQPGVRTDSLAHRG